MRHAGTVDFLLEALGATLTIGEVSPRVRSNPETELNGLSIKNGATKRLRTLMEDDPSKVGSLSLFDGAEKVGTLNWQYGQSEKETRFDWTPISKNFSSVFFGGTSANDDVTEVRLKLVKMSFRDFAGRRGGASLGTLGLVGL